MDGSFLKSGMDLFNSDVFSEVMVLYTTTTQNCTLQSVRETYQYYMELGDKRVEEWPLMGSPFPTIVLTALYLAMCRFGPRIVPKSGVPWDLRPFIVGYNLVNIVLNGYIALELFESTRTFNWVCEPVNYSSDPASVRVAAALWWYYASKCFEQQ